MIWPTVKIGEVAEVKGGKRLPKGQDVQDEPTSHPYLRVTDFSENGLDPTWVKYITDATFEKISRYTISATDIYVSIAGTIGRVGMIPSDFEGANLTENAAKITNIDGRIIPKFLLCFLRSDIGQKTLKSEAGGTSQPKLALYKIAGISVPIPEAPVQERISSLVSGYDELIENNRRRMVLLEEAARLLYREWFVYLRFPGHEHAKIIDGVPEGWERRTLGDHCPFKYGKALKADIRVDGDVDVFGSSGIVGSHNQKLVDGPAIIVGRKGNVGSIFWAHKPFWPIDTVYYIAPENTDLFTYYALKNSQFISTDVAVPGLNRNYAHSRQILLPDNNLLADFLERVAPMHEQCRLLERAATELTKARDLLLPRLMDGRIEV